MIITPSVYREKIHNDGECIRTMLATPCKKDSDSTSSIVRRKKKYIDVKNMTPTTITRGKKFASMKG